MAMVKLIVHICVNYLGYLGKCIDIQLFINDADPKFHHSKIEWVVTALLRIIDAGYALTQTPFIYKTAIKFGIMSPTAAIDFLSGLFTCADKALSVNHFFKKSYILN